MTTPSPHLWKRAKAAMETLIGHGLTPLVRLTPDGSVEVTAGPPLEPSAKNAHADSPPQSEWKVDPDAIKQAESAVSRRRKT